MQRMFFCFTVFVIVSARSSAIMAAPVDCDQLTHSKVPFALTVKNPNGETVSQNYRSDQLFLTKFLKNKNGEVIKFIHQGSYVMSVTFSSGVELNYKYWYANPSQPIYEAKPRFFDQLSTRTKDGKTENMPSGARHSLSYVGVEGISLGPCVFQALHYIDEVDGRQQMPPTWTKTDNWFAPNLGVFLRNTRIFLNRDGSVKETIKSEATAITTEFEPYKFP